MASEATPFFALPPTITGEEHRVELEKLLANWHSVWLAVKPCEGLELPTDYMPDGDKPTVLLYGLDFAENPIPDIELTDKGISATLSFCHVGHKTFVPYRALVAVSCSGHRHVQERHLKLI